MTAPAMSTKKTPATSTCTITATAEDEGAQKNAQPEARSSTPTLRLTKKRDRRHIHWSPEVIDNEDLNKKKSNSKEEQMIGESS